MQRPDGGGSLRERVREVMEPYEGGPGSTWLSLVVDLVVLIAIAASCALVVLEWVRPEVIPTCRRLELLFTLVFIVEYALRWYSAPNRWTYPWQLLAVVDLLAILPGLLMLGSDMLMLRMLRGARLLRLLRLLRLVRLLRLLRYGPLIYRGLVLARVWCSTVIDQYRLGALGKLFVWAVVTMSVGANVLYMTESAFDSRGGPFEGYWASYWNILIVLISGIEDKEPISLLGRIEVTVLLIAGLVIVGMLTGEIVSILIRRVQRAGMVAMKPPYGRFEQHIVILGINRHVDNVIRQVHAALRGQHHILVVHPEADELQATDLTVYRRVFALKGEPRDARVLEAADIDDAARVIVLAPDHDHADGSPDADLVAADNRALMAAVAVVCRKQAIPLVVELTSERSLRYTHGLPEVDFVVGRAFAERLLSQAVLHPGVTEVYERLMSFSEDTNELYTVPVPPGLIGSSFIEAQLYFLDHDAESVTLIGIDRSPPGQPSTRFVLCPQAGESQLDPDEQRLGAGDRLIVLAFHRPSFAAPETAQRWKSTWLDHE